MRSPKLFGFLLLLAAFGLSSVSALDYYLTNRENIAGDQTMALFNFKEYKAATPEEKIAHGISVENQMVLNFVSTIYERMVEDAGGLEAAKNDPNLRQALTELEFTATSIVGVFNGYRSWDILYNDPLDGSPVYSGTRGVPKIQDIEAVNRLKSILEDFAESAESAWSVESAESAKATQVKARASLGKAYLQLSLINRDVVDQLEPAAEDNTGFFGGAKDYFLKIWDWLTGGSTPDNEQGPTVENKATVEDETNGAATNEEANDRVANAAGVVINTGDMVQGPTDENKATVEDETNDAGTNVEANDRVANAAGEVIIEGINSGGIITVQTGDVSTGGMITKTEGINTDELQQNTGETSEVAP